MVKRLPNGITAIVLESHAAPVVAVQCWVNVGGADETPEEAGLAHLHEHMLFKGTARRGTGEIARTLEAHGGEVNAWTSHDQTVYHVVLASEFLSTGLDVLSDALRQSAFDERELARETQVVVEEIKRSEDSPSRRLSRELFAAAYATHPYGKPVIGTPESVLGFVRPKILAFYRKHYTPSNVVVVAVGDVTEQTAFQEIERWFGDWQAEAPPHPERPSEPTQVGPRVRVLHGGFRETRLALAFHVPDLLHPDVPAIDLLGVFLGQGESSRLQQRLIRAEHLFQEVHAYGYTPRDPGLFVAGGTPTLGREIEAIAALLRELAWARTERVSEAELERAKHLVLSEQVYQRETVQGLARKAGFYQTVAGTLDAEADYLARIQAATADDLLGVAERYLHASNATFVALEAEAKGGTWAGKPLQAESLEAQLTAALPPRKARPVGVTTLVPRARELTSSKGRARAPLSTFKLVCGATLLVKSEPEVPLVAMRGAYLGGVRGETEADNGVTALLGRTVTRGAGGRTADAIATAVDGMAGALGAVAGRNSFGLRFEFLARHLDTALPLFADCLLRPDFPPLDVERERAQLLQEIHARDDHPAGLCFELFNKTLFTQHPYRLSASGELASVEALTPERLRGHLESRYPLSALTLSVVGDVEAERVRDALEQLLPRRGGTAPAVTTLGVEPRPRSPRHGRRALDKAQTHLLVGYLGVSFTDPDRLPMALLSSALSGQGGRLFLNLRDKHSLAYSVSSMSIEGVDPGYFAVYIGTSPEKRDQALAAIRAELCRVCETALPLDELERAQQSLIGANAIGLQRRSAVAGVMALDASYGLGAENYLTYAARIRQVTSAQILRAAQRVLVPSAEVVAEVGPGAAP